MKNTYKALLSIVMTGGALLLLAILPASAQMKIGNHPTQINQASILELESPNQALRLTQGDTAKVNLIIGNGSDANSHDITQAAVQGAEGMIMYQAKGGDSSLYMRMNGWWHKIMSADQVVGKYFKIGGNATDTSAYLGLTTADSLVIGTNSATSIVIMPDGVINVLDSMHAILSRIDSLYSGVASIDMLTVNDSLSVAGSLRVNKDSSTAIKRFVMQGNVLMTNLMNSYGADTALLSIGPDGAVHRMDIDSLLGANKPTINGLASNIFHLQFGDSTGTHAGPWIDTTMATADSAVITLNIPNAAIGVRGLVDTASQAFQGNKMFADSVAIGTTTTPTSTFQVNGNVGMAVKKQAGNAGGSYDMTIDANSKYRTIIVDVSGMGTGIYTVKLPTTIVSGRIYTIKKIGTDGDNQISSQVEIDAGTNKIDNDQTIMFINNNWTSVTVQAYDDGTDKGWAIVR